MKQTFLFLTFMLFSVLLFSQQGRGPQLTWKKTVHDFGQIKEVDGEQWVNFEFTNTGDATLFITQVVPSCGCTSTDWSKEPIAPGAKGFVKGSYNPAGRPGKFNKSITVTSNEFQPTSVIRMTGEVIPRPQNTTGETSSK